ncbi:MAG TPA: hypothetical protein VGU73_07135 [Acidimicrobiia bacterium]|nr:hypothetical protein [Acidimicrobiia bacterium]
MSNDPVRDLRQRAEDAAYTAVGVGVLGFQQAQVRRRAVQQRLVSASHDARAQAVTVAGDARTALESLGTELKARVEPVVTRLGGQVEPLVSRIGEQVEPLVADVRTRVEPVLESLGVATRRPADPKSASKN